MKCPVTTRTLMDDLMRRLRGLHGHLTDGARFRRFRLRGGCINATDNNSILSPQLRMFTDVRFGSLLDRAPTHVERFAEATETLTRAFSTSLAVPSGIAPVW